ncbi:hypothetical protein [Methylovulum psychrotolerans]|uniref:Uncharacterized protein n=1 Tax=Methylovulum psychrotolerans TaxID=1704499 RepID=A0A2S5CFF8_9GAMM|nr:hypothetical protein [Methylovulum psychrotolerans]POZ49540.1 hypothetical protein AADEFJLK_04694 [Methylovulum psychrotolerans]
MSVLQEPLTAAAHEGIAKHCGQYALCVHDWSRLSYKHLNKTDTYAITHATDVGYDLQSSLIVSDLTGLPVAPVAQRLVSVDGSYATYGDAASPSLAKNHLEEVADCIQYLDAQGFPKPVVHMIDREGDSVAHIRRWDAAGSLWVVRAKDDPKVDYADKPTACKAVAAGLAFSKTRQVSYHGKAYWQWVAEAEVTLGRPAKPSH